MTPRWAGRRCWPRSIWPGSSPSGSATSATARTTSGQLPVIVPTSGWGFTDLSPATEWPTVYPFLLREMYRSYGDERLLREHWDSLTRYLAWELDRVEDGLSVSVLGDWLPPGFGSGPAPEDRRLTGTAYLYRALLAAAEIGDIIGAAERLSQGRGRARRRPEPGVPGSRGRALPVGRGPGLSADVERRTARVRDGARRTGRAGRRQPGRDIEARGFHLNTGCLGVGVLLPVLTAHGHSEVATKVALQRTYPSWGYWFDLGADTMWEKWEVDSRSRNHYFQGTVVQWISRTSPGSATSTRAGSGSWSGRTRAARWTRRYPDRDDPRPGPSRGTDRAGCCRSRCRFRSVRRPRSTYRPRLPRRHRRTGSVRGRAVVRRRLHDLHGAGRAVELHESVGVTRV